MQFVALTQELREHLNQSGHGQKLMIQVGDGSFCNRTVLKEDWTGRQCEPGGALPQRHCLVQTGSRQRTPFLWQDQVHPEEVRRRDSRARWQKAVIFHGGCYREVRYKELTKVYWQGGAKKREVRLLVVAPVGYRTTKKGRKYYRQPAYLLTTDLTTPAVELLQAYFDRWGIEVNHRDEKEIIGVGEAQVWNPAIGQQSARAAGGHV